MFAITKNHIFLDLLQLHIEETANRQFAKHIPPSPSHIIPALIRCPTKWSLFSTTVTGNTAQYLCNAGLLRFTFVNMLFSTVPSTKNAKNHNFDNLYLFFNFTLYSDSTSLTKWFLFLDDGTM